MVPTSILKTQLNVGVEEQKRRPERGIGSILTELNDVRYAVIDISP